MRNTKLTTQVLSMGRRGKVAAAAIANAKATADDVEYDPLTLSSAFDTLHISTEKTNEPNTSKRRRGRNVAQFLSTSAAVAAEGVSETTRETKKIDTVSHRSRRTKHNQDLSSIHDLMDSYRAVAAESKNETTAMQLLKKTIPAVPDSFDSTGAHSPQITSEYLDVANEAPVKLAKPIRHLLVLDLNHTLLARVKPSQLSRHSMFIASKYPILRPGVDAFLEYCFQHYEVMVWSSAMSRNVWRMASAVFKPEQLKLMVALWDRRHFHMSPNTYNQDILTYKFLWRILYSNGIREICRERDVALSYKSMVLLDDEREKAAAEPFNHIPIAQFDPFNGQPYEDDKALEEVVKLLEELRFQENIPAYLRSQGFGHDIEINVR